MVTKGRECDNVDHRRRLQNELCFFFEGEVLRVILMVWKFAHTKEFDVGGISVSSNSQKNLGTED
jgi:hypothetical protein